MEKEKIPQKKHHSKQKSDGGGYINTFTRIYGRHREKKWEGRGAPR